MRYDPAVPPDPDEWLALDEAGRIAVIEAHHRKAKIRPANLRAHAGIDSAVETQLAEELPVTVRALARLLKEGLGRADAIHAIGSAMAGEIFKILKEKKAFAPESYGRRLDALDAAEWKGKDGV